MTGFSAADLLAGKKRFHQAGVSFKDWAVSHGFKPGSVTAVLGGRNKGLRGEGHDIAVALGLKPAPDVESQASDGVGGDAP